MILGRLVWELQRLLDNTSKDATQTHLRSGRLSRNWAAVARGAEDVFERRRTEDGIDSAVMVALDQSHSMCDNAEDIIQAALAVEMFSEALKRCAGVASLIAGFANATDIVGLDVNGEQRASRRASWKIYKGWREGAGVFSKRKESLNRTRGTTPDTAALQDALKQCAARPEKRKVLIWIGDGDNYDARAAAALQRRYSDVVVIGVGIRADLSKVFKHSVRVDVASDLARASFAAVQKALAA